MPDSRDSRGESRRTRPDAGKITAAAPARGPQWNRGAMGDCRTFPHFEKDSALRAGPIRVCPTASSSGSHASSHLYTDLRTECARKPQLARNWRSLQADAGAQTCVRQGGVRSRKNQNGCGRTWNRWVTPSSNAMRPRIFSTVRPHRIYQPPANLARVSCSNYPLTMNESRIWRPLS
jgi:hypothetical protein